MNKVSKGKKGANRLVDLKKLIAIGKERGRLTYEEVNDLLPGEVTSPEEIDEILTILGNENIEIVDSKPEKAASSKEEKEEGSTGGTSEEREEPQPRSEPVDDPVRMYLRQMGQIPLLSRENELALAKEIKAAEFRFRAVLFSSVFGRRQVLDLVDRVKTKKLNPEEFVTEDFRKKERARAESRTRFSAAGTV